jgi:hypothetical protein
VLEGIAVLLSVLRALGIVPAYTVSGFLCAPLVVAVVLVLFPVVGMRST